MRSYAWGNHDDLITTLASAARTLRSESTKAVFRITSEDEEDRSGEHHAELVEEWRLLQARQDLAKITINLCDWERLGRAMNRSHSPWDAEPAVRSRYAWALGMSGDTPVSPMRALFELEKRLCDALERICGI